jgi:hypothetical protein
MIDLPNRARRVGGLLAIVLFGALTLASCASRVYPNSVEMPEAWVPQRGQPSGMVIGSIGALGITGNSHVLHFRPVGSTESNMWLTGGFRWRGNVNDRIYFERNGGAEVGEVFHVELPVGEYEIYQVMHKCDYACGSDYLFVSKPDFSVRFRVGAGDAVYIGRFLAVPRLIPGQPPSAGYFPRDMQFAIVDEAEADLRLLESATRKTVDRAKLRKEIADPRLIGLPEFRPL